MELDQFIEAEDDRILFLELGKQPSALGRVNDGTEGRWFGTLGRDRLTRFGTNDCYRNRDTRDERKCKLAIQKAKSMHAR